MTSRPDIVVVGAGAWGQALAVHLARLGRRVALWARRPDHVVTDMGTGARMSRRLPGVAIPAEIEITGALDMAADAASAVLVVVPVQHLRPVLGTLGGTAPLVLCGKGIEARSGRLPLELAAALAPGREAAVLSGPNFAIGIAQGHPAASVLASRDLGLAQDLAQLIGSESLRVYPSDDPSACQIGGAAKNVVAIAAGAAMGAGFGANARAALITRGLAEIARLAIAEGGRAETVFGLSGLGDLVLTCTGELSRNYGLGEALGRGVALADCLAAHDAVVEGVATAPLLVARAATHGIELPIATMVTSILRDEVSISDATRHLLARPVIRE